MFDAEYFDSEATDILTEIGQVFADEFDAPVTVLTASLGDGMITGQLMSGGDIYNYAADGNEIGFDYSPEDSEEVNEYARGFLESGYGIKADSMDSPYEYASGLVRLDAQVKCKKGGVPCGKICLPKGAKCKKYSGSGNAAAMKQAAGKLKSPGKVAAGIGAGLVGSAALAGGASYLAYKNRDKLGEPGRKLGVIGTRVKSAAREGKEEFTSGVNSAKQILKTSEAVKKGLMNTPPVEGVSRKEGYKLNTAKKTALAGSSGAGAAGAVGAVAAGTENAINAVKYNLTRNPKFSSGGSGESNSETKASPPGGDRGNRTLLGRKIEQKLLQGSSGKEKPSRILVTPAGKEKNPRVLVTSPPKEGESFPVAETAAAITATTQAAVSKKKNEPSGFTRKLVERARKNKK